MWNRVWRTRIQTIPFWFRLPWSGAFVPDCCPSREPQQRLRTVPISYVLVLEVGSPVVPGETPFPGLSHHLEAYSPTTPSLCLRDHLITSLVWLFPFLPPSYKDPGDHNVPTWVTLHLPTWVIQNSLPISRDMAPIAMSEKSRCQVPKV